MIVCLIQSFTVNQAQVPQTISNCSTFFSEPSVQFISTASPCSLLTPLFLQNCFHSTVFCIGNGYDFFLSFLQQTQRKIGCCLPTSNLVRMKASYHVFPQPSGINTANFFNLSSYFLNLFMSTLDFFQLFFSFFEKHGSENSYAMQFPI